MPTEVSISDVISPATRLRPYLKRPDAARASTTRPWDVPALCRAYGWPTHLTGDGVIAIVELGGGWIQQDLNLFCENNHIPVPSVTDVSVDGTRNAPGVDPDSDGEVALDIQVAAAACSVATGKPAINPDLLGQRHRPRGARRDPRRVRRLLDLLGHG